MDLDLLSSSPCSRRAHNHELQDLCLKASLWCRVEDPRAEVKWLQYLRVGAYLSVLTGVCIWSVIGEQLPMKSLASAGTSLSGAYHTGPLICTEAQEP